MTPRGVLGVGAALVDVLAPTDDQFLSRIGAEKGGMVMVDSRQQDKWIAELSRRCSMAPGGAAANTVFALARLGTPAALLAKLGEDSYGEFYRRRFLDAGGTDDLLLTTGALPTGRCLSLITPDSERTMRSSLGASQLLTAAEADAVDYSRYDLVYVEGYLLFLPDVAQTVLRRAREAGCQTAVDLASFEVVRKFREPLLTLLRTDVDLVFANRTEAEALIGHGFSDDELARRLGGFCRVGALKLGSSGALIACSAEITHVPAERVRAVDTTSAGDTWAAGFLYGYLRGFTMEACGRIGSMIAAEVVQTMGSELTRECWNMIRMKLEDMKDERGCGVQD